MTTGSGSSFPLTRLAAQYNKMNKDGRVLSNRATIDIIDTRIMQLLGRIDQDEAPDRLANLSKLWETYKECVDGNRSMEAVLARKQIDEEFKKAYDDYMAWRQMFEALDLRGKSVEREVKVLKEIKAIMTAEDAYELSAKMLAAVMRVVNDDPKKLKQVQYEFSRIIGESSDLVTEGYAEEDGGDGGGAGGETGFDDLDQEELLHPRNP